MSIATEPGLSGDDVAYMRTALALAARNLGSTWPNPSVGCLVLRDGRVAGRGWTQRGGRPHAETVALRRAGPAAVGATLVVTLEPCNHHGSTPPCTEAILAAGIARVVGAVRDPDPRVDGTGFARLAEAGIAVTEGVLAAEAAELNAGFFLRIREGRPLVTLKLATSLDGRIAAQGGASRWITGAAARARGHLLRARHDAILVGSNTALVDDPELTVRIAGLEDRSPVRIVADGHLRLPLTARLVRSAPQTPTWILTLPTADPDRRAAFADCGVSIVPVPADADGNLDLGEALRAIAARGVTRLMVEGGSRVAAGLLRAGLVDRIAWFRAPIVIGGDGIPAAAAFGIDDPARAPRLALLSCEAIGDDLLETYRFER